MQYKIINGIIFSEVEVNDNEKIQRVLKDAENLINRPKALATMKGILEKTRLDHDSAFVQRLIRLDISRTTDYLGGAVYQALQAFIQWRRFTSSP